jgi:ribulose-5-phosphate 4-epimerase/fuculose-1-phosphate aldolase
VHSSRVAHENGQPQRSCERNCIEGSSIFHACKPCHITLRVPGLQKAFLINPFGLHYREVTASNLVALDIEGTPVRPTDNPVNLAGFVTHSAIHANVDVAHCVMHTHTTTGSAVACSGPMFDALVRELDLADRSYKK